MGKHRDNFIEDLVNSTIGKTDCLNWKTDGWGGYERVLPTEINHEIGKENTQRLERTNGILRQQTGRWHRQQNALCQSLGADQSHGTANGQLFQLDLGS